MEARNKSVIVLTVKLLLFISTGKFSLEKLQHGQDSVRALQARVCPGLGQGGGVLVDNLEGVGHPGQRLHGKLVSSRVSGVDDL